MVNICGNLSVLKKAVYFLMICCEQAEKFEEHVGKNPVLAIRGVKVSDFGGTEFEFFSELSKW